MRGGDQIAVYGTVACRSGRGVNRIEGVEKIPNVSRRKSPLGNISSKDI